MSSLFEALAELERAQQSGALCTVVRTRGSTPRRAASKMLVYADGRILGTVGGGALEEHVRQEALESIKTGEPRLLEFSMADPARGDVGVCGGQVEVYVEPILPAPLLIVIGGGHVGKAVVHLAKWLGFRVAVSDDRPEFCAPEAVPGADLYYPVPMAELPTHAAIDERTSLVLTTRGVETDVAGLPALLSTPAGYIGVIGSRRRWKETEKRLRAAGTSKSLLSRVHSPIGLELNAETPEEIAVSILAEILMLRAGGSGRAMKDDR